LRWRFDIKTPTRKWHASSNAKILATCYAPVSAKFQAKTESKFFANLSPAQHPDGGYPAVGCQGRSKGESLGSFLGYFLSSNKK
jgi:hypothetical protein